MRGRLTALGVLSWLFARATPRAVGRWQCRLSDCDSEAARRAHPVSSSSHPGHAGSAALQMFSLLSSTAALRLYSSVKHERARFKGAAFLWRSGPNEGTAQWTTLVLRARLLSLLPGASPHLRLTFGTRSCNDDCVREPESVYNGTFGIREKTGPFFGENREGLKFAHFFTVLKGVYTLMNSNNNRLRLIDREFSASFVRGRS